MKKLLAIALFAAVGAVQAQPNFTVLSLEGNEMIVAKLSETEAVYVTSPKVACRAAGTVANTPSLLVHYTEAPAKKATTALWSVWSPSPATMPAYVVGYGKDLCSWFNKM